jgi:curved DNA-binding protein CbpA
MAAAVRQVLKGKTFYDVLGVSRLSQQEEIRAAYLSLAKKYHPDSAEISAVSVVSAEESEAKFREIQEAYSTLSNQWKRTLYDQDLQFQTAMAVAGSSQSSGVSAWRENFNLETPEARIARRERYKRYAAGERNDLPPVLFTTSQALIGLVLCGTALTYVCAKAPSWFGGQGELSYHDPVTDDSAVELVSAFYNPITRRWERIAAGQSAPHPKELFAEYRKYSPQLMDRWEYEEKQEGNDVQFIETLTTIRVPKTRTVAATVFRDSEGNVGINRRTMNDAIARFIPRIA